MFYNKGISNFLLSMQNFIVDNKIFLFVSWLSLSFPYNKIWSKILVLSLIMRSSISLMSLRRTVLSTWNKWQHSKKWDVVSGSDLHSHRELRKSRKLCLNLCSFKWLKPNRSLVNSCNPMGLWIPNVSTCFGRMKLDKAFLKAVYDVMLLILMSSLFHSVMTFGKEEFLKYFVLHLKDGTFLLFLVS